jgi:hypothetical protein
VAVARGPQEPDLFKSDRLHRELGSRAGCTSAVDPASSVTANVEAMLQNNK